jgi:hypothetical protein
MASLIDGNATQSPVGLVACIVALLLALGTPTHAQTIAPEFARDYSFSNLGLPSGVPGWL